MGGCTGTFIRIFINTYTFAQGIKWATAFKNESDKNADIKECFVVFVFVFFWGAGEGVIFFVLQFIRLEKPNRWYQVSPKQHKNKIQH